MTASLFILAGAGVFLAIALGAVIYILNQHNAKMVQAQLRSKDFIARQQKAVWASATILSLHGGIVTGEMGGVSNRARYELRLKVNPPGGEPYLTRTTWLVEVAQMSMLQQGQQLSIKIDQEDPSIIYPNVGWAKFVSGG